MNPSGALADRGVAAPAGARGAAPEAGDSAEPGRALAIWLRVRKPLAAAWAGSMVIHLVILLLAALITVGGQAGGARPDEPTTIGIAVLTEAELGSLMEASLDAATPTLTETIEDPLAIQVDLMIPEALTAFDEPLDMARAASELTEGLGAGDVTGGALGGAGGAASFFGVEAKGTRFAYIVDISGSMDIGIGATHMTRIAVLRNELYSSVASLLEHSRFFIALFHHESMPLGGKLEWTPASDAGKAWARRHIAQIAAAGGTEPLPAFRMVFSLRPRPDAIYFMTDGEFSQDAPRLIALMNADLRIPIHCICFDSTEGESLMRKIAEDSGGTYNFVSGVGR